MREVLFEQDRTERERRLCRLFLQPYDLALVEVIADGTDRAFREV